MKNRIQPQLHTYTIWMRNIITEYIAQTGRTLQLNKEICSALRQMWQQDTLPSEVINKLMAKGLLLP